MTRAFLATFALLLAPLAHAGDVTGKIQVISPQTDPGWNGVMIQMADGAIVDTDCGNNTWALIRIDTDMGKALLSVAISAKIAGETVGVFTTECSVPPETLGTIPIVSVIDLGVRG